MVKDNLCTPSLGLTVESTVVSVPEGNPTGFTGAMFVVKVRKDIDAEGVEDVV